jgi:transcriptional regulator with XRE-family HTH domain
LEGGQQVRENLKKARKAAGMTQQQMAEKLGIGLRHYKKIENGETLGSIELWDLMEDLFNIHQRKLRQISENHLDKANNL